MTETRRNYTPYKRTLIRSFVVVAALAAAIPMFFLLKKPWDSLAGLIDRSHSLLGAVSVMIMPDELRVMNAFALENLEVNQRERDDHIGTAFNMLLIEDRLVTAEELAKRNKELDHAQLAKWYAFWRAKLDANPEALAAFRSAKRKLVEVKAEALRSGFDLAYLYIMADMGVASGGFFENSIAFVLQSSQWWEGDDPFPGEAFHFTDPAVLYWRESYLPELGGAPGYFHNPLHDPLFPRFDTDEWGTWFTAWLAAPPVGGVHTTFNIDFNASDIRALMTRTALGVGAIALVAALIIAYFSNALAHRVTRPIRALTRGARAVRDEDYRHTVLPVGTGEFVELIEVFNDMIAAVREKVNLMNALSKLTSRELAERAAKGGLYLGGEVADATIMFTDFAGFSTITRRMKANEVVELLNSYFAALIPIIKKYGGTPDKYIGDAIVAIFGAPVPMPNHAELAVRCAIEMQRAIREINTARLAAGKLVFEMRVGLNSGKVVVGAIGCDQKLEYTAIGVAATLANRMESICKIGHVMMAEATYARIKDAAFEGVEISVTPHRETVKGYTEPVRTYGVYVSDLVINKLGGDGEGPPYYRYERRER
ncbi:MAG: HAMP domain-containing protein [Nitrospinae bacterium]|nr:HAMP domain-containing protein [Nitrospinota bacterium]